MKRLTRYIALACLLLFTALLYLQVDIAMSAVRSVVVFIAAVMLVNVYTKMLSVVNPDSMVADGDHEDEEEQKEEALPVIQEEKREKSATELAGQ